MVSHFIGFVGQIVRVDPNTVAPYEAWPKRQEVPFGAGGLEHLGGIEVQLMKQDGEFVHEGDIEVALGVLDDLGGFCDLDAGGPIRL